MTEDEATMRFRGGVGFDHASGKWKVVVQIWIEPDMTAYNAMQYTHPREFETADEAEAFYRDELRGPIVEPMIARAQKEGATVEHLVKSVQEIGRTVSEPSGT